MPDFNDTQSLLIAAETYQAFGYSVIPVFGDTDPDRPKVPAISWGIFQQRHASPTEVQSWFMDNVFQGLGIVTGRISQLVVLDFDTPERFAAFKLQYPDLVQTRTVQSGSRGLPHLYFHLPSNLHIASQRGQGVDLLSDGRYVVAPPTIIKGKPYRIMRGGLPKTLSERDIRRLQAFMAPVMPDMTKEIPKREFRPSRAVNARPSLSSEFVEQHYQSLCSYHGRNEALFRASLLARDHGWRQQQTEDCLVPVHVQQPGAATEPEAQRQREAFATIRSAYSRKPRQYKGKERVHYYSNSVREALVQRKLTNVVRTLEGLLWAGIQPGQRFTAKQAVEATKGVIGRDSIHNALQATGLHQKPLFTPLEPPIASNEAARNNTRLKSKKCFFDTEKKSGKNVRGRPTRYYRMPHNLDLCRLLNVAPTGSDPIQIDDLVTARRTRMAMHREFINRRPGYYPRRWLARRLGITLPTIDTYNRLIPIHSRAVYLTTVIDWNSIERLPFDESPAGTYLETGQGKRYPARRTIAQRLLARGENLRLRQRTVNYYWYGDSEPAFINSFEIQSSVKPNQSAPKTIPKPPKSPDNVIESITLPDSSPDANIEIRARQLYNILNSSRLPQISMTNARRLVSIYSAAEVSSAIKILQQRSTITNSVGFLMTILRSTSKSFL